MILIFMRNILTFLFLIIGVLACIPHDLPLEEEKNPDEEIPVPEPEFVPEHVLATVLKKHSELYVCRCSGVCIWMLTAMSFLALLASIM